MPIRTLFRPARVVPAYGLGLMLLGVAALSACSRDNNASPKISEHEAGPGPVDGEPDAGSPSDENDAGEPVVSQPPDPPRVYVAKVKNLLIGAAPSDDELMRVEQEPAQLRALIEEWMTLPMYRSKLQTFFELAFQQTQISITDLADQAFPRQVSINQSTRPLLLANVRESFARTVLTLLDEHRPFTEVLTTRRFMLTPALMEMYAFLDAWQVDNAGKVTDRFRLAHPKLDVTIESKNGPIPIADSLLVGGPNYMHWYTPDLALLEARIAGCGQEPIVIPARSDVLHFLMHGSLVAYKSATGTACPQYGGSASAPALTSDDFNSWKMVTVRQPAAGEEKTLFFDLPTLRSTDTLVIGTPRVGFFTTPAFFANWQTNVSNQMRVTINQALIVALGAAVDGLDHTQPSSTPGLTAEHSEPAECKFCHQTLDPTRSILSATYSWTYHDQLDPAFSMQKGLFAFQGVEKRVKDVYELGDVLASHPLFAQAWVQKLCYYANSAACDPKDPEFLRVVALFESSHYDFSALVAELFSSPLVTGASATSSRDQNQAVVAVARRDHLCAALNTRLGFTDVCGLAAQARQPARAGIQAIVPGLPSDGYGRGAVAPVLPNQPNLFYRAGMENICAAVAELVIDVPIKKQQPGAKQWQSAQAETAIAELVSSLMALASSDPRAQPARELLQAHFSAAKATGASAADALKSTFVVACLSPSFLAIGL